MQTVNVELFSKCVGFTLTVRKWSNARKASLENVTVNADKSRLRMSKRLIVADEYDAILSHIGETCRHIDRLAVPSFFKRGFHLVGNEAVPQVEEYCQHRKEELALLVEKLAEVYPTKIVEAGEALRDEFDPSNYPDVMRLIQMFSMSWNFVAFGVPESLPAELFAIEKERQEKMWAEASDQIMLSLRESFGKLIKVAKNQLTTEPGEKKKKIFESMLGNIHEFIETFNHRNITNDTELGNLVNKAKKVLEGVSIEKLRKDDNLKDAMQAEFASMSEIITGMIETTPVRSFDFETE